MKKAVFLDRDGVINEDIHHLNTIGGLRILPGVGAAINKLNARGYQVVVITNQGAIAKGLLHEKDLHKIHNEMTVRLAKEDARIDGIYYCPHHPEGTVADYAMACDCRKPEPGMIKRAVHEMHIDLTKSFLVGDKHSDIIAGNRMGLKTILVKSEYANGRVDGLEPLAAPHFFADDLADAIHYIP